MNNLIKLAEFCKKAEDPQIPDVSQAPVDPQFLKTEEELALEKINYLTNKIDELSDIMENDPVSFFTDADAMNRLLFLEKELSKIKGLSYEWNEMAKAKLMPFIEGAPYFDDKFKELLPFIGGDYIKKLELPKDQEIALLRNIFESISNNARLYNPSMSPELKLMLAVNHLNNNHINTLDPKLSVAFNNLINDNLAQEIAFSTPSVRNDFYNRLFQARGLSDDTRLAYGGKLWLDSDPALAKLGLGNKFTAMNSLGKLKSNVNIDDPASITQAGFELIKGNDDDTPEAQFGQLIISKYGDTWDKAQGVGTLLWEDTKDVSRDTYNSLKYHGNKLWNDHIKPLAGQAWENTKNLVSENPEAAIGVGTALGLGGLGYAAYDRYKKKKKKEEEMDKEASVHMVKSASVAAGITGVTNYLRFIR